LKNIWQALWRRTALSGATFDMSLKALEATTGIKLAMKLETATTARTSTRFKLMLTSGHTTHRLFTSCREDALPQ
jgi:hypothetical protein